jgi:hypothetical protein
MRDDCTVEQCKRMSDGKELEDEQAVLDPYPKSRTEPPQLTAIIVDPSTRWERGDNNYKQNNDATVYFRRTQCIQCFLDSLYAARSVLWWSGLPPTAHTVASGPFSARAPMSSGPFPTDQEP